MDTLSKRTGEEYNTSNCLQQTQTRPKKFRKTLSSSSNYMESLPDDVIFEILVRVPAQDHVCNSTRLVCRKWHDIINTSRDFKHAHLQKSTCGLLVHDTSFFCKRPRLMTFVATGSKADDLIEVSKLSYRSQHDVLSSCNGLLLEAHDFMPRYLYIMNPATNQKIDLPPFFPENMLAYGSTIAHVATTMEYKVVRSFLHSQDNCVAILTVGVDKDWTRRVNTQHLSLQAKKLLLNQYPLTTQHFVHWANDEGMVTNWAGYKRKYEHVLTLNVETEIITQFPLPSQRPNDMGIHTQVKYLPMGSYLSLLILRSEFSWELWEMKPETGEWTEMPSIDLKEAQLVIGLRNKLKPVGWLRPREVLVFSVEDGTGTSRFDYYPCTLFCFAFTVRTRKLQKFSLDGKINRYHVHRNSLVWIDGC